MNKYIKCNSYKPTPPNIWFVSALAEGEKGNWSLELPRVKLFINGENLGKLVQVNIIFLVDVYIVLTIKLFKYILNHLFSWKAHFF